MFESQRIAEADERITKIQSRVGNGNPVMQMDFNLTPTRVAMIRQTFEMATIILFGRIKIRVRQGSPVAVAPRFYSFRILATPTLEPSFLLIVGSTRLSIPRHNRRFKVIRKSEDKMNFLPRQSARQPLPNIGWTYSQSVSEFLAETASWRRYMRLR